MGISDIFGCGPYNMSMIQTKEYTPFHLYWKWCMSKNRKHGKRGGKKSGRK